MTNLNQKKDVFNTLSAINVNEHTEKKGGLTYLAWGWAWTTVKSLYPEATYTIYENQEGLIYHHDKRTAWVKTGVTIEGMEMIEYLPIMDFRNKSIPLEKIDSTDVNKAIQRSITKAIARHGLGIYIFCGENDPTFANEDSLEEVKQETVAESRNAVQNQQVATIAATQKVNEAATKQQTQATTVKKWNKVKTY